MSKDTLDIDIFNKLLIISLLSAFKTSVSRILTSFSLSSTYFVILVESEMSNSFNNMLTRFDVT